MAKLLDLSWLSPRIIAAMIDGGQPKSINRALQLPTALPVAWTEQEALLGISA